MTLDLINKVEVKVIRSLKINSFYRMANIHVSDRTKGVSCDTQITLTFKMQRNVTTNLSALRKTFQFKI